MRTVHRLTLSALAAPLALALAACGDTDRGDSLPTGEPIAEIAAPAGTSWVETAAVTPEGGHVIGNPGAPLKLVEYASHTCGGCANFAQEAVPALEQYVEKGIVSYEIRNLVRDPIDLTIAMLARCGDPAAFHPLANQAWNEFDTVMGTVQANSAAVQQASLAPEPQRLQAIGQASGLLDFFAARGISRDQAMQCFGDTAQARQIAENSNSQSEELGVNSTPTFFLNGRLVELSGGAVWPQVEAALQAAGAR
jgi:protein-disulfide isomerase